MVKGSTIKGYSGSGLGMRKETSFFNETTQTFFFYYPPEITTEWGVSFAKVT